MKTKRAEAEMKNRFPLMSAIAGAFALATFAWLAVEHGGVATTAPLWLEPVLFAGVAAGLVFVLFTSHERRNLVAYSRAGWAWLVAKAG